MACDWGARVATIGPLRVRAGERHTASYMQAATAPGFQTDVHQHGGPEGLFTLSGEVCVETPEGKSGVRGDDLSYRRRRSDAAHERGT